MLTLFLKIYSIVNQFYSWGGWFNYHKLRHLMYDVPMSICVVCLILAINSMNCEQMSEILNIIQARTNVS